MASRYRVAALGCDELADAGPAGSATSATSAASRPDGGGDPGTDHDGSGHQPSDPHWTSSSIVLRPVSFACRRGLSRSRFVRTNSSFCPAHSTVLPQAGGSGEGPRPTNTCSLCCPAGSCQGVTPSP